MIWGCKTRAGAADFPAGRTLAASAEGTVVPRASSTRTARIQGTTTRQWASGYSSAHDVLVAASWAAGRSTVVASGGWSRSSPPLTIRNKQQLCLCVRTAEFMAVSAGQAHSSLLLLHAHQAQALQRHACLTVLLFKHKHSSSQSYGWGGGDAPFYSQSRHQNPSAHPGLQCTGACVMGTDGVRLAQSHCPVMDGVPKASVYGQGLRTIYTHAHTHTLCSLQAMEDHGWRRCLRLIFNC